MKRKTIVGIGVVISILVFMFICAASSFAQPPGGPGGGGLTPQMIMKDSDTNGDNKLTRKEWLGPPDIFDLVDENSDGFVTLQEIEARPPGGVPPGGKGGPQSDSMQKGKKGGPRNLSPAAAERAKRQQLDTGPKVGDIAPTFTLMSLDGKEATDLAKFKGRKPVVLFFGSYS